MIIICINNYGYEHHLTLNKKYDVIFHDRIECYYRIMDDSKNHFNYSSFRFINLNDARKQKLRKI